MAWLAMRITSASASTFATAPTASPAVPARSSSSRRRGIQRRRTAMRHPSASARRGSAHRGTRARHGHRVTRRRRDRPTTCRTMTPCLCGAQSGGGISEGIVWELYYTLVTSTMSMGPRGTPR
ncbi:hypothetical protein EDB86DRAFT_1566830 [Lactarius hatsudake]|nr:hypothetical protein EDB86DRAFT_1566830 [Lactarius hatsudake]